MISKTRLVSLALILLLVSGACTLLSTVSPQKAPTQKPVPPTEVSPPKSVSSPTVTPEINPKHETITFITLDGETIEAEAPAPNSVQLLYSRINQGEITLQDAALDGLRLLTGLQPKSQVFSDIQTLDGFIFSNLVVQAYAEADNPTRQEIDQMYRVLAPTREVLAPYSEPFDWQTSFNIGGGKLASPPADNTTDCRDLWGEGFPADHFTSCLLYITTHTGGAEQRVYFPLAWRDRADYRPYLEAASQALDDSIRVYGEFQAAHPIDVIFSINNKLDAQGRTIDAYVPGLLSSEIQNEACPVIITPIALSGSVDLFKQTLAHEIFHCVEYWKQGTNTGEGATWYIEGMAEFFSGVVYPSTDNEYQFLSAFNEESASSRLVDMDYPTWVFFQYLSNQFGHDYVFHLLEILPKHGGVEPQITALANVPGMKDIFHQFGQTYLDRNLHDENGSILPLTPYFRADYQYTVGDGTDILLDADAFMLSRYLFSFDANSHFNITYAPNEGSGLITTRHYSSGNSWEEPPTDFTTLCQPLQTITLVTSSDNYGVTLQSNVLEVNDQECDACLVGVWKFDDSQWTDMLTHAINLSEGAIQSGTMDGSKILEFSGDGTFTASSEETWTFIMPEQPDIHIAKNITQFTSAATGIYSTRDNSIITTSLTSLEQNGSTTFTLSNGVEGRGPLDSTFGGGFPSTPGDWPYSCSADTLTFASPEIYGLDQIIYTKVSDGR